MQVVVPLAGPDFISSNNVIKGLIPYCGKPIICQALGSRPWVSNVSHYIFILKDCLQARDFYQNFLYKNFPQSSAIYLSCFSQGAALSALAGTSLIRNFSEPIIVDLADIIYSSKIDIEHVFSGILDARIALAFESQKPHYSYLKCTDDGYVIRAVEKNVISNYASVGTYIFRDCPAYLRSLANALVLSTDDYIYNNLYYVCPLFNGTLIENQQVKLEQVSDVLDLKDLI